MSEPAQPSPSVEENDGSGHDSTEPQPEPSAPKWWIYFVLLLIALPLAGYGIHSWQGETGFYAYLLGVGFGLLAIGVGKLCVRRQANASQAAVMREMMLGSFVGVFLFLIGTVVIAKVWKDGLKISVITALFLYMSFKFFEVWVYVAGMKSSASSTKSGS